MRYEAGPMWFGSGTPGEVECGYGTDANDAETTCDNLLTKAHGINGFREGCGATDQKVVRNFGDWNFPEGFEGGDDPKKNGRNSGRRCPSRRDYLSAYQRTCAPKPIIRLWSVADGTR